MTPSDKILAFLKDVAKLDTTKYTLTSQWGPLTQYPEHLGGLSRISGGLHLESETSKVDVPYKFVNDTLCSLSIDIKDGNPQYSQPPLSNNLDSAKAIVSRLQTFTGDSTLTTMNQMLEMVDSTKNVTIVSGNLALEVSVTSARTMFEWKNVFNGAKFSSMYITIQNGSFREFRDDRSYIKIGSTEVNISKDKAIAMALNRASDFSYDYGSQKIANLTILQDNIWVNLLTRHRNDSEPLVLYPYWQVNLPLDHMYPGFVTWIVVEIWADTSEVFALYGLGSGGDVSPNPSPSPSASPAPSSSSTSQPSQAPTSDASPSPSVSASPQSSPQTSLSPSQSQQPSASASSTTEPTESSSPTIQPSASPQLTGSPEETAGFPVQKAVAVVAVAAIVCVTVLAVWFLRKRRT